jgi:transcriptional regulator with XRE-family HTH domain
VDDSVLPDRALRWRLMGANLRRLRDLMGQSQEEIANVFGVSQGQVSKFERGQAAMTFDQVTLLARHWDLPLLTLIEELGTPIERDWPSFADWYAEFWRKRSGGTGGELEYPSHCGAEVR